MKRREFLGKVGGSLASVAAGGAVVTACGGNQSTTANEGAPAVHTQKKIRWRLTSSFPRSLDTIFGAAEFMSERVKAMTDGNFDIRVYPAGELVPGLQVLDAVQNETVQIGQTCSYYYTGKNPVLAFDTCVPFGLTARQQQAWLGEGGGGELMAKVFSDFGIRSFPSGNTGAQMGGWFKEELSGLDGLKGLKMRIPGLGGDVMSALGASVQVIAGGEIYPALERGAIDATEWVGPYDDEKLGFYKVAKNYYYPGWWEPGPRMRAMPRCINTGRTRDRSSSSSSPQPSWPTPSLPTRGGKFQSKMRSMWTMPGPALTPATFSWSVPLLMEPPPPAIHPPSPPE
jgi:TRAP-type mannitol/chloroaromatic compound transport system substrate-binding protein